MYLHPDGIWRRSMMKEGANEPYGLLKETYGYFRTSQEAIDFAESKGYAVENKTGES